MVQPSGRHYFDFGDTEVRPKILEMLRDDLGMSDRVPTVFVDVGVQTEKQQSKDTGFIIIPGHAFIKKKSHFIVIFCPYVGS